MKIERIRPTVVQATFHAYELAALMAAARWALEGAEGEFPAEARAQLENLLASYDDQTLDRTAS